MVQAVRHKTGNAWRALCRLIWNDLANQLDLRTIWKTASKAAETGRDEGALFTFDSALHERQAFTRDLDAVARAFPDVEPFGSTSLYDAIAATARCVEAQATGRRAIVVITDGIDTSSRLTAAEVSGLASSIDLPLYIIAAVAPADRATLAGDRTVPTAVTQRTCAISRTGRAGRCWSPALNWMPSVRLPNS